MSATTAPPEASIRPVVGTFDDVGRAEHAVHDLHAAGFGRDEVAMEWEEVEVPNSAPLAPRSYAAPFAFVCSLIGGAALAMLAAHFAPRTLTLGGFGWPVSPPVILALVGGTFGWILGAILGFGHIAYESEPPGPISLQAPVVAVSVIAPTRPGEARAILHASGARGIEGGDRAYPAAQPSTARPAPRRTTRATTTGTVRRTGSVAPSTPAGRHERLPLGTQASQGQGKGAHTGPRRTGLALLLAAVAGAVVAVLRRRRD